MDWLLFVLAALAAYRLTVLVAEDDGPADLLLRLRQRCGAYDYDADGMARSSLGRGIACPHCVSMWVALPVALAVLLWRPLPVVVVIALLWLALSGAAILAKEVSRA